MQAGFFRRLNTAIIINKIIAVAGEKKRSITSIKIRINIDSFNKIPFMYINPEKSPKRALPIKNVFAMPTIHSILIKPAAEKANINKLKAVNTIKEAYFLEKNTGNSPTLPRAVICLATAPTNIRIVQMHKPEARIEKTIFAPFPNKGIKSI
jgi:hypothetical protein